MRTEKRAVALGIFDGVHLGHRAVMKMTENSGIPAVFTFKNTSLRKKQGRKIEYIYTDAQKSELMESLGIKEIFSEDFSMICDMSGEEFVKKILAGRLNASLAVCGGDFRFGREASCGVNELAELGGKYGFEVRISEDVTVGGSTVSSGRIRSILRSSGDCESAARLLGDDYFISGEIVRGRQIGRTLDFPTINQLFGEEQLVPRFGAYASETKINGKYYQAVTNIGVKPTVGGEDFPLAETHIIDFSGDLYGRNIKIVLKSFLRPEMKFHSLDELKEQISMDIFHSILRIQ